MRRYADGMDVAELSRQIEYKVAPEPLLAVQALANTFSYEDGEERLIDVDATRRWLVDSGLTIPAVAVGEAEREQLVELRVLVRALIDANLTGEQDEAANERLAALAATHPVPVAVEADGSVGLDLAPTASVDDLVAQMIGIVLQAQIDGTWERLKVCGADDCRWAFFDASKNRQGHWCSMEICGNREKNRSYRRRQATA
jgi:predicted RNA-binding Zn ribbon-like protein